MRFLDLSMLYLLWGLPILFAAFVYAEIRRRQALERFVTPNLLPLLGRSLVPARRRLKAALLLLAFLFATLGLARPAWNPQPKRIEREGRDVVFVLDVSRSMLAEDLKPNRLTRAKLAIRDCLDVLEGDRVALVAFAGHAVVACPLTQDYGFFRMMLESVSPATVNRGGTLIGDALRKTLSEVFDDLEKKYKDILLITDGEDHDSFPIDAAAEVGKRGIRLIAVGIGDETQGQRIPIQEEGGRRFLTYKDQEVWSKLQGDTLRKMVEMTPGGRYLPVGTAVIDLGDVYRNLIASAEKKRLESQTITTYEEKFQIFVGLALLALAVELLIPERRS